MNSSLKTYCLSLVLVTCLLMLAGPDGSRAAAGGDGLKCTVGDYIIEHTGKGGLSIVHKPSGTSVLTEGRFHADVAAVNQSKDSFTLTLANKDSLTISPRKGSAFLELKWSLKAPAGATRKLANIPLLSFSPSKGRKDPVTLGTGGPSADNSYMFLVNADKTTRGGLVTAWLTSQRGSGVVLTGKDKRVTARMDYGAFDIAAGKTETTDPLLLGWFDIAMKGLESYGDQVAGHHAIKLPPQLGVYCTWYHARASNEQQFAVNTDFSAKTLKDFGLDVMQIDDGWQLGIKKNGPKRDFTAHNPKGPYPSGMKKTADHVTGAGMVPGIWWMPFAGTAADPHYADKQGFFVKDAAGKPREVRWGGTCMDMTNPKALAYTRENARQIAKDWHYRYFKLDGLWTGFAAKLLYVNDAFKEDDYGMQKRFNPAITPVEAYRMGMKAVRDGAGKDVFILGCNLAQNMRTMGASYGLFDAMRVGPDNSAGNWGSLVRGAFNSANRYFLHGRVWYNDPDPHYVRPIVPLSQARTLSSWVGLTGFLNTTSEQYDKLPTERLDLLKRTLPAHGLAARPSDYLEQRVARVWIVSDDRSSPARHAIGFFNWEVKDKKAVTIDRTLSHCDLDDKKTYVGFDFWNNEFLPEITGRIKILLPYNECRIWSLREKTDHPMVVSTSRHVTQGIVDIVSERWDAGKRILSAESKVVAGDPYELRIYTPKGEKPKAAELIGDAKGATIELVKSKDKAGIRILIAAPKTAALKWQVKF